jgi:enoyl-CoA hydratase
MAARREVRLAGRVTLEVRGPVAVVTLDHADRRNILSAPMIRGIGEAFDLLEKDPEVRCAVVTGAGSAFCAGAELAALEHAAGGDFSRVEQVYEGFLRVGRSPVVSIAAVNGAAIGAGLNLALACDVRLVAPSAYFETRFADMHLLPGGGHVFLLEQAVGRQAATMAALFGERLSADVAVRTGLAWAEYDDDALVEEAVRLGERLGRHEAAFVRALTATLRSAPATSSHEAAIAYESYLQRWSTTRPAFRDGVRELREQVERRASGST